MPAGCLRFRASRLPVRRLAAGGLIPWNEEQAMSDVVRDAQSHPGYYLPEGAQYRLQQLRDHMRFLARLAQPRTQAEEQTRQPAIRMDELALCLELLAEQVTQALAQVQWPARLESDASDNDQNDAGEAA